MHFTHIWEKKGLSKTLNEAEVVATLEAIHNFSSRFSDSLIVGSDSSKAIS